MFSTADSMRKENEGWLVRIEGTVTRVESDTIYINDGTGEARVFMDGYIKNSVTGASTIDENIMVGAKVSAVGFASVDNAGARLRVRDLSEIQLEAPVNPTLVSLTATPSSTNLQNSTTVTITVTGHYSDGSSIKLASASVKLKQSGTQMVKIGEYDVTVVVNSNNKITDVYVGTPTGSAGVSTVTVKAIVKATGINSNFKYRCIT